MNSNALQACNYSSRAQEHPVLKMLLLIESQLKATLELLEASQIISNNNYNNLLESLEKLSRSNRPVGSVSSVCGNGEDSNDKTESEMEAQDPSSRYTQPYTVGGALCGRFQPQCNNMLKEACVKMSQLEVDVSFKFLILLPAKVVDHIQGSDLLDIVHVLTMFGYFTSWNSEELLKNQSRSLLHDSIGPFVASILTGPPICRPRHELKMLSYLGRHVWADGEKKGRLCGFFKDGLGGTRIIVDNGQESWSVSSLTVKGLLEE